MRASVTHVFITAGGDHMISQSPQARLPDCIPLRTKSEVFNIRRDHGKSSAVVLQWAGIHPADVVRYDLLIVLFSVNVAPLISSLCYYTYSYGASRPWLWHDSQVL